MTSDILLTRYQEASCSCQKPCHSQKLTKTLLVLGLDDVVIRRLLAVQGELQHALLGLLRSTLPWSQLRRKTMETPLAPSFHEFSWVLHKIGKIYPKIWMIYTGKSYEKG